MEGVGYWGKREVEGALRWKGSGDEGVERCAITLLLFVDGNTARQIC